MRVPTAADLRKSFRDIPAAQREANQSFSIRVWRGLSWLERAEQLDASDIEGRFVFGWIGFNALYGRMDSDAGPWSDRQALGAFLAQVWRLDRREQLRPALGRRQTLVLGLIENRYLSLDYWIGERAPALRKIKGEVKSAILCFTRPDRLPILRALFDRLYVMRNQVFHGASTKGSRLNRRPLQDSARILLELLPCFLAIMIEHGSEEDWGDVCFPPRDD